MAKALNVSVSVTANTAQAKAQLQELQATLNQLGSNAINLDLGLNAKQITEATAAVDKLSLHLKNATNVNTGTLDFAKLSSSIKASGSSLQAYGNQLLQLGPQGQKAFSQLTQAVTKSEIPMSRLKGMMGEFGTVLTNTIRWQAASSAIHGMMGAVQHAFSYAQNLNKSLTNIQIVTGQSDQQMAKFAESANRAAKSLSTTTTSYTDAALIYYQQGIRDQKQIEERTNATIKMANVTGQSAEKVSDQMTAIWNNFAKGGGNLEYYADVITALGAATASSSEEISKGLEKFASIADTVGLSYENATAALATITATTRQSADSVGTGLRTLFSRLQSVSLGETLEDGVNLTKYSKALETVGVQVLDTNGNLRRMDDILLDLGNRWDNISDAQKVALAQTVGGVRQYTTLMALMNNFDFYKENLGVAKGSAGTLQNQADIYAKSWEAAQKRVQASAESIYSSLINDKFFITLNNGFSSFLNLINDIIAGFGGLKGLLPAISALMLNVFSDKISAGMVNFASAISMLKPGATKAFQEERTQFLANAASTLAGINNPQGQKLTPEQQTQLDYATQEIKFQQAYARNQAVMTPFDKQYAQQQMDRYSSLRQQYTQQQQAIIQRQSNLDASRSLLVSHFRNTWRDAFQGLSQEDLNKNYKEFSDAVDQHLLNPLSKVEQQKDILKNFSDTSVEGINRLRQSLSNAGMSNEDIRTNISSLIENQKIDETERTEILKSLDAQQLETVNRFAESWDLNVNAVMKYKDAIVAAQGDQKKLKEIADQIKQTEEKTSEAVNKRNKAMETANNIVSVGQALTSLTSAASAAQSSFSGFINLFQGEGSFSSALSSLSGLGNTILMTGMALKSLTSLVGGPVAWAITGITVALGIAKAFYDEFHPETQQEKIERLQKETQDAQQAANDATSAYENLTQKTARHNELLDELDKMTVKTNEFKQSLEEANAIAQEVITSNGLVYGKDYYFDNNSIIRFKEGVLENTKKISSEYQQRTSLEATLAQLESDYITGMKNLGEDYKGQSFGELMNNASENLPENQKIQYQYAEDLYNMISQEIDVALRGKEVFQEDRLQIATALNPLLHNYQTLLQNADYINSQFGDLLTFNGYESVGDMVSSLAESVRNKDYYQDMGSDLTPDKILDQIYASSEFGAGKEESYQSSIFGMGLSTYGTLLSQIAQNSENEVTDAEQMALNALMDAFSSVDVSNLINKAGQEAIKDLTGTEDNYEEIKDQYVKYFTDKMRMTEDAAEDMFEQVVNSDVAQSKQKGEERNQYLLDWLRRTAGTDALEEELKKETAKYTHAEEINKRLREDRTSLTRAQYAESLATIAADTSYSTEEQVYIDKQAQDMKKSYDAAMTRALSTYYQHSKAGKSLLREWLTARGKRSDDDKIKSEELINKLDKGTLSTADEVYSKFIDDQLSKWSDSLTYQDWDLLGSLFEGIGQSFKKDYKDTDFLDQLTQAVLPDTDQFNKVLATRLSQVDISSPLASLFSLKSIGDAFDDQSISDLYSTALTKLGGEAGVLKEIFASEDIQKAFISLQQEFRTTQEITTSNIEELASASDHLQAALDNGIISAGALADIIKAYSKGTISSIDSVSNALLNSLKTANNFDDTLRNVYKNIDEFDAERSVSDIGNFYKGLAAQIEESLGNGMLLDPALLQAWEEIFGPNSVKNYKDTVTRLSDAGKSVKEIIDELKDNTFAGETAAMKSMQEFGDIRGVYEYLASSDGKGGKRTYTVTGANGEEVDLFKYNKDNTVTVASEEVLAQNGWNTMEGFVGALTKSGMISQATAEAAAAEFARTNPALAQIWQRGSALQGADVLAGSEQLSTADIEQFWGMNEDVLSTLFDSYDEFRDTVLEKRKEAQKNNKELSDVIDNAGFIKKDSHTRQDLIDYLAEEENTTLDEALTEAGGKAIDKQTIDELAASYQRLGMTADEAYAAIDDGIKAAAKGKEPAEAMKDYFEAQSTGMDQTGQKWERFQKYLDDSGKSLDDFSSKDWSDFLKLDEANQQAQDFANIMTNTLKSMFEETTITISLDADTASLVGEIRDAVKGPFTTTITTGNGSGEGAGSGSGGGTGNGSGGGAESNSTILEEDIKTPSISTNGPTLEKIAEVEARIAARKMEELYPTAKEELNPQGLATPDISPEVGQQIYDILHPSGPEPWKQAPSMESDSSYQKASSRFENMDSTTQRALNNLTKWYAGHEGEDLNRANYDESSLTLSQLMSDLSTTFGDLDTSAEGLSKFFGEYNDFIREQISGKDSEDNENITTSKDKEITTVKSTAEITDLTIDSSTGPIEVPGKITSIEQDKNTGDTSYQVELDPELNQDQISMMQAEIEALGGSMTVETSVDGETGPLIATIDGINGYPVTANVNGNTAALSSAISSYNGTHITVTVDYDESNKPSSAMGINNASVPGFAGGRHSNNDYQGVAETGELGPELWIHNGEPYLTGVHGRNKVFISKGDQIFTADQTRKILANNPELQDIPGFRGGTPNFSTNETSGYTSTKGKKKGGGGGGDAAKEKDFDPERYHLISRQLAELERQYDRLEKAKNNAYGTNKLDAIQREIDKTNELIDSQEILLGEIEKYRQEDLAKLTELGIDFKLDAFGNIKNWDELQDTIGKAANNGDEAATEQWKAIQKYEETIDKMHEAQDQMQDYVYQSSELTLENIQTQVELVVKMDDRFINFIDHFLNKLDDEVYDVAEALGLVENKMAKINDQIEVTANGLTKVLDQMRDEYGDELAADQKLSIDKLVEIGKTMTGQEIANILDPYHINGQFGEAIEKYVDDLLKYIEALEKLKTEGIDRLDKAFDKLNDNISKSMDLFNYYNDVLSTMRDITELQGTTISKEMRELGKELNKSILNNTINELEAERANYAYLQKAVDDLQKQVDAETDKNLKLKWQEELDKAEEKLRDSNQQILSLIQNGLEQARTMFENTLDGITSDYASAISGMYGTTEELQNAFDRKKEIDDFYVDDYEKYYQIAKLQRSITSDLDKAARAGNRSNKGLKQLQEELNAAREDGVELTSYDLDVFAKRYEYEKAMMELEDARNNKSEVRLQRDANGNWGYVYTSSADEDDLLAKQQAVDDALYEWQKTVDDQADEIQATILGSFTNIISTANDMLKNGATKEAVDDFINDELTKLDLYSQKFGTSLNDALLPLDKAKERYGKESFDALDNYAESVLASIMDMDLDEIYDWINKSVADAQEALNDYNKNIARVDTTGGYEDFIDDIIKQQQIIDSASEKTKEDTLGIISESAKTFDDLMAAAIEFENKFLETYQGVIESNEDMIKYLLNVLDALNRYEINDGNSYKEKPIVVNDVPSSGGSSVGGLGGGSGGGSGDGSRNTSKSSNDKDKEQMMGEQLYDYRGIPLQYSPDYKGANPDDMVNPERVYVSSNKGLITLAQRQREEEQKKKIAAMKQTAQQKAKSSPSKGKIKSAVMDTGGFTGDWGSSEGRWAILHEKEQVFNKDDTAQLLSAAKILRTIDLQADIFGKGLSGISIPQLLSQAQELKQNIHIDATFPNATDHNEIEMAFDNLINKASQYANRKNMSAMTFQDMYTSKF